MADRARIVDAVEQAEALADGGVPPEAQAESVSFPQPFDGAPFDGFDPPAADVDWDVVKRCAALDHSDTDNATRLIAHFGRDLSVMGQDGVAGGDWLGWCGTHWDHAGGAARVRLIAQELGARILLETRVLGPTEQEQRILDAAQGAETGSVEAKEAAKIRDQIARRRQARKAFAVTSKNSGRMEKALECAAPRLRRAPEGFNPDRLKVACQTHTLQFVREVDLENPDEDGERYRSRVVAHEGHRREDWLTALVPLDFKGESAPAPGWRAFMAQMLPDEEKRRTVQQFCGLGLLGLPTQFVMFHYGLGANGKSVFLETLSRALGPGLAVGLPRESIVGGNDRGTGQASPDLVRLYGKRMVRINEVRGDVPLQEDLVKRLTGGEAFPVRSLFKGYFEFQSVAKPHMSGNGFPTIDGTDNGIWRRLLVVHWDQVVPEDERRDLEEMVASFVEGEGPGVLAWLIEGALDYLANGLVVAPTVRTATDSYREEMDPIGDFRKACVRASPGQRVQSRTMYQAYRSWSEANSKRARTETKFGRTMKQHFSTETIGGRIFYADVELHSVPERPSDFNGDPGPQPDW